MGLGRDWQAGSTGRDPINFIWLVVYGKSIKLEPGSESTKLGNYMQTNVLKDAGKAVIKLVGRFDFNTHRDFRSAYEPLVSDADIRSVTVDFSGVDYLDSSALGMLLMLRDKLGGANKEVALSGVRGNVKQVLDIANFSKLFNIS